MNISVETVWQTLDNDLRQFVRQRVNDPHTAEDLLQDIYLKIHAKLHTLEDDERLYAWVYQIARNTIYDHYRRQRPVAELEDHMAPMNDPLLPDTLTEQVAQMIRNTLDELPAIYREAVYLAEVEGLTQREVAQRLGLSVSGAKSRVQRGRSMIREMLAACCHFHFDRLGKVIDYTPRCTCCEDGDCR